MNKNQIKKELADERTILKCAREFNVIGDPTRLKICYLLCHHNELSVSEIADSIGVSVSAVSHTLRKLKEVDIVTDRRDFRHVYYQLIQSPLTNIIKGQFQVI